MIDMFKYLKQTFSFILIFFFGSNLVFSQMKTAGHWPESLFKEYPNEHEYVNMVDIAYGDWGWFDDYVHAVMIDRNERIWLAGQYGLAYSDDNGLTWQKNITKYAIYEIFETRNHTLLASSNNDFVLRSEDGGENWSHQKVFGKNGPTGKSSHGENYNDIFYLQVDDKHILRTTDNSEILLLTDDEGKSWKKAKAPDYPKQIFNIGDSVLIMFSYDKMYISDDKGKNWKLSHDGLPKPDDEMYDVIDCGVVMEDGFIMALINPQEQASDEDYAAKAYKFDLKERKWKKYVEAGNFEWRQGDLTDLGENRMMMVDNSSIYGYEYYLLSLDKGITWGIINGEYKNSSYPRDFYVYKNKVYMILGTSLTQINFPVVCEGTNLKTIENRITVTDSLAQKVIIFPIESIIDSGEVALYQKCDDKGEGFAKFILHIPDDGIFKSINLYHTEMVEENTDLFKYDLNVDLKTGDYELWLYDKELSGCFSIHSEYEINSSYKDAITVCYFY
jgi:hypothetical protein